MDKNVINFNDFMLRLICCFKTGFRLTEIDILNCHLTRQMSPHKNLAWHKKDRHIPQSEKHSIQDSFHETMKLLNACCTKKNNENRTATKRRAKNNAIENADAALRNA